MKLQVVRRDGSIETINVVGPAEVHHGEGMDHLHSADGMDHYFLHDGIYDGWGMAAREGMMLEDSAAEIARIERERRIDPPPPAPHAGQEEGRP